MKVYFSCFSLSIPFHFIHSLSKTFLMPFHMFMLRLKVKG